MPTFTNHNDNGNTVICPAPVDRAMAEDHCTPFGAASPVECKGL
ncbi:hypothetical protein [Methylovulum psychrotolerans]|nr:hypothetical protein [Methylovulum psychrotolerans]